MAPSFVHPLLSGIPSFKYVNNAALAAPTSRFSDINIPNFAPSAATASLDIRSSSRRFFCFPLSPDFANPSSIFSNAVCAFFFVRLLLVLGVLAFRFARSAARDPVVVVAVKFNRRGVSLDGLGDGVLPDEIVLER